MSKETILAVDDEEDILELIRFNLLREGFGILTTASGEAALKLVKSTAVDLIVLDLMLPGMDGLEVTRRVKADDGLRRVPIVILSAKGEEADIVAGLELGADDYVVKPFSPRVLLARVKAVLRRQTVEAESPEQLVRIHRLIIDPLRRHVRAGDRDVELTFTEFQLLYFLAKRPGWVFTRSRIVDAVKGDDYPVTDRSVDVQIVGLRKKLGVFARCIETVRGVGYRFT